MLTRLSILIFGVVLLVPSIENKSLPKYIQKCSLKEDTFSNCAVEVAKKALPSILAGDKQYKIQELNPAKIPLLQLNANGLNVTLTDSLITGADTVDFNSIKYDKNSGKFAIDMNFDHLKVAGEYAASGRILILPIVGSGHGSMDFKKAHIVFTFDLKPGKNGKLKTDNPILEADFGGAIFQMDNLFNGDKRLGDEMNRFLNENWKEVIEEFKELLISPMRTLLLSVASGIIENLTLAEAFEEA